MSLSAPALEKLILAELAAQGLVLQGPHARAHVLAKAIANAVVGHIQNAAIVTVDKGSSSGTYKVT